MSHYDVLIIGSGIAGLSVALAARGARVALVSRGELGHDGASAWAQGGIAAALAPGDTPAAHAADTIAAGAGYNDARAVATLVGGGRAAIAALAALGVAFDRDGATLALGREAAHGAARIVHAGGDATGANVMRALAAAVRAAAHVTCYERTEACELALARGRVGGAWIRGDGPHGAWSELIPATHTVLATGGIGQLYRHTTNPATACGDGLVLALRAGARLRDLELVQFHPTALAVPAAGAALPLVTEALRGAGAVLRDAGGGRFMPRYDARAELAPRDVVARAVFAESRHGPVVLDARAAVGADFPRRFPTVFEACQRHGIDPRAEAIPVTAAAHYHMGGVAVDATGASSVAGLYAVGECAGNRVHGANRLASNSLLEGLVFGRLLGVRLAAATPAGCALGAVAPRDAAPSAPWPPVPALLRQVLWDAVGVRRRDAALRDAITLFEREAAGASDARSAGRWQLTAALATAAAQRSSSLGAHHRDDAPPVPVPASSAA